MDKINKLVLIGLAVVVLLTGVGFLANSVFGSVINLIYKKWQISGIVGLVLLFVAINSITFSKKSPQTDTKVEQTTTSELIGKEEVDEEETESYPVCPKCGGEDVIKTENAFDFLFEDEVGTYACENCGIKYVEQI